MILLPKNNTTNYVLKAPQHDQITVEIYGELLLLLIDVMYSIIEFTPADFF